MRKVDILKVGAATIVRTYDVDQAGNEKPKTRQTFMFNKATNVSATSDTTISVLSHFDAIQLVFALSEVVENYTATTAHEYVEKLAENYMFNEAEPIAP